MLFKNLIVALMVGVLSYGSAFAEIIFGNAGSPASFASGITGTFSGSCTAGGNNLCASSYTPTLSNITNLDASTPIISYYQRIANVVHVGGTFNADCTAGGSASTRLYISLPIASNLTAASDVGGVAFDGQVVNDGASIKGNAANDVAEVNWKCTSTSNNEWKFNFTYEVK